LRPSCVVIGALCKDIVRAPSGSRRGIGGTAYYFSAAFAALGGRVGCVSRSDDEQVLQVLRRAGIDTRGVRPGRMSLFELSYFNKERTLRLFRHSSKIGAGDVPADMIGFDGLHLGPVEHELDASLWDLRDSLGFISLDVQGLARVVDPKTGQVTLATGLTEGVVRAAGVVDVIKFGEEEARNLLGDESEWDRSIKSLGMRRGGTVLITLGPRGSLLFERGEVVKVPAYPSRPIDWTGAGDTFMAGFVYQRLLGRKPLFAAMFGSALAASVIERPRPLVFPRTDDVLAKIAEAEARGQ